jgi:hypothetical protein
MAFFVPTILTRGPDDEVKRMSTVKEYSDTAKRDVNVDVDALLAAINEISERNPSC